MAKYIEMDESRRREFEAWRSGLPDEVRRMVDKYPVDRLYKLKTEPYRVTIEQYYDDGMVEVEAGGEFNLCIVERTMRVPLTELIECPLPDEGELVGALLSKDEVAGIMAIGEDAEERVALFRKVVCRRLSQMPLEFVNRFAVWVFGSKSEMSPSAMVDALAKHFVRSMKEDDVVEQPNRQTSTDVN